MATLMGMTIPGTENIPNNSHGTSTWLSDLWNGLTGQTAEDKRTAAVNDYNLQATRETNQANRDIATQTNMMNYSVAQQNLGFQRELQEYNKALQQQMFEREDTSYARTAKDMANAGLNPLSMQGTNGAGEAIALTPQENTFQAQQSAPMQAHQMQKAQAMASPIQALQTFSSIFGNVTSAIDQIKTGRINRDILTQQKQMQAADYVFKNFERGIYEDENGKLKFDDEMYDKWANNQKKKLDYDEAKMNEDMREWKHMDDNDIFSSDTQFSRLMTDLQEWLLGDRGSEFYDKLEKKYPILKMLRPYAEALFGDKPYDTEVTNSKGKTTYYKNGVEVDKNGNPVNKK